MPDEGSSNSSAEVPPTSAMPRASLRLFPPLSWPAGRTAISAGRHTRATTSATAAPTAPLGTPYTYHGLTGSFLRWDCRFESMPDGALLSCTTCLRQMHESRQEHTDETGSQEAALGPGDDCRATRPPMAVPDQGVQVALAELIDPAGYRAQFSRAGATFLIASCCPTVGEQARLRCSFQSLGHNKQLAWHHPRNSICRLEMLCHQLAESEKSLHFRLLSCPCAG